MLAAGDELTADVLPDVVLGRKAPRRLHGPRDMPSVVRDLVEFGIQEAGPHANDLHERVVNQVERELIAQVMGGCDDVQIKAAARLGINRNTLHKKLKEYGLEKE